MSAKEKSVQNEDVKKTATGKKSVAVEKQAVEKSKAEKAKTENKKSVSANAEKVESVNDKNANVAKPQKEKSEAAKAIAAFGEEHKTVLQFIKFTLISMIAGLSETAVYWILYLALGKIDHTIPALAFLYLGTAPAINMFVAVAVSAVVGQVVSFVVNFKKTFNSTNNIVASAIGYAIMALLIIFGLNVYICNLIANALSKVMPQNLLTLSDFIAKAICMAGSFVIVFPMNKFVIMREKKETPEEKAARLERIAQRKAEKAEKDAERQALIDAENGTAQCDVQTLAKPEKSGEKKVKNTSHSADEGNIIAMQEEIENQEGSNFDSANPEGDMSGDAEGDAE